MRARTLNKGILQFLAILYITLPSAAGDLSDKKEFHVYHHLDIVYEADPSLSEQLAYDVVNEEYTDTHLGDFTVDGDPKYDILSLFSRNNKGTKFVLLVGNIWLSTLETAEEVRDMFEAGTPVDSVVDIYFEEGTNYPTTKVIAYKLRNSNTYGLIQSYGQYDGEFMLADVYKNCRFEYRQGEVDEGGYNLSVTNGTGNGSYDEGAVINIEADTPAFGKVFDKWTGDVNTVSDINSSSSTILIPASDISITATFKDDPNSEEYPNLVLTGGWDGLTDEHGSALSIDSSGRIEDTIINSSYTIIEPDAGNDIWPWAQMSVYIDGNLGGIEGISITYKSDKPMNILLDQDPLAEEGTSYKYTIPASSDFKTIDIPITEFAQPEWLASGETTPLDLSSVSSISFSPVASASSTDFSIKSIIAQGYTTELSPTPFHKGESIYQNFRINNLTGMVHFDRGTVSNISMFTINGKLLATLNVSKDMNRVNVPHIKTLGAGSYLIKIKSSNNQYHFMKYVQR